MIYVPLCNTNSDCWGKLEQELDCERKTLDDEI